jgi:hypothetical protein
VAIIALYLSRRFARKDLEQIAAVHLADWQNNPKIKFMGRLIDRKSQTFAQPGMHMLHLDALQCANHPLPADFLERLKSEGVRDGGSNYYGIASRKWAEELGCAPRDAAWKKAGEEQELELIHYLETHFTPGFAASEESIVALAWLYYTGRGDQVKREWLAAVNFGQRDDGGWAKDSLATKTNNRATVHALWVLLESGTSKRLPIGMIP